MIKKNVIAGIAAGIIFLLLYLVFNIGTVFSILLAVFAYIGVMLLVNPSSGKELDITVFGGVTIDEINQTIAASRRKNNDLIASLSSVRDVKVKKMIEEICDLTEKILADIEKDPKDIRAAKNFLSYFQDAAINIVSKYIKMINNRTHLKNAESSLKKAEDMLTMIKSAYEKQLQKLYEDDILDLDTEITVLEKTIKHEGLGE